MKVIFRMSILIVSVFMLFSTTALAAEKPAAKTSPPPLEQVQPYSFFDPKHIYLQDGAVSISKGSKQGNIRITATTYAKKEVESIGVTFYLQKWNGKSWVDVGPGLTSSAKKQDDFDGAATMEVESGYYYRAHTVHWISSNGVYEQGDRYSDSILM